jgi:long-chain acyl-CoA synthetase
MDHGCEPSPMWWQGPGWPAIRHEAHFGDRVLRCFHPRPPDLYALLQQAAERFGDNEAVVCGGTRLSWREVMRAATDLAAGLARLGVARGDRVVLFLSNRPEFVVGLFAVQRLGAIVVPVGVREQRDGLAWILGHCGAKALLLDHGLVERVTAGDHPGLALVVCGAAEGALQPAGALAYEDLLRRGAADVAEASPTPAAVAEEDVAAILYTSGTTGRPKGAMLTQLGIVHSVLHYIAAMGLTERDRSLLAVPATHVTGLIANVAAMVGAGGTLVLMPEFKAAAFLDLAEAERVTHTLMVPAMYKLLLLEPDFARRQLSAWRIGGFGGAPMPVATIDALAQVVPGLTLLNAYGATETTSPTTLMPLGQIRDHADSVGVPLPSADVLVVDDDGRELPRGEVGEIWIAGPMVVSGYWNNPEACAREFTAGWWHSGDLGSIDAQGFVRVVDRKKDMLNRGGYKIFSVEVENTLARLPGVVEAAIVGKPCPVLGERVHAFIHAPGANLTLAHVRDFCAERLADYKVPESVSFTAEPLPRNLNGKLLKRELRGRLESAG